MKTNTTKKVGLITAVLILLAIISADYLRNANRNIEPATAPLAANVAPRQTQDITGLVNSNARTLNYNPVYAAAPVAAKHTIHHNGHTHYVASTNDLDNMDVQRFGDYNAMAVNNTKKPEIIAHQTSRDHYGYVTVDDDGLVKPARRVHLGVQVGYNLNNLNNTSLSTIPKGGFHAGGIMDVSFGKHFALQPAILYTTMGTRYQNMLDVENKEKLTLHYIQVPINMVFKIGNPDNTQFLIGAGPYFSYLLNAKDNFQSSNPTADAPSDVIGFVPETHNFSPNKIQTFDYGVNGFLGLQAPDGLFMRVGAQLGLTDIQQNTSGRNYSLMVSAGYLFGY